MSGDIVLGIRLKYDGKDVTGGVEINRGDFRKLTIEARNAGTAAAGGFSTAAQGARSLSAQLESAKNAVVGYFGVTQALAGARWIVDQASAVQQLEARLRVATSSAAEYARAQAGVFEVSNRWGAAVEQTAGAFARLNPVIAQMGGGSQTTLRMLDGLAASLRLSGATAAETSAVLTQFAQAMGSGRVGGDEFRSMMESAEPLMRAVAGELGKTTAELRQMAEDGKLTSSVFGSALLPAIDKLKAQAEQIPLGVSQSMQVLRNEMGRAFGTEFADAGTAVADAIKTLAGNADAAARGVHAVGYAVAELAKATGIAAIGAGLGAAALSAQAAASGISGVTTALNGLTASAALARLEKLSMAGKAGLVGLALWGGYEVGAFVGEINAVKGALAELLEPLNILYDKKFGDARRGALMELEAAKTELAGLRDKKQQSPDAWVMTPNGLRNIDNAIQQAQGVADRLQLAWDKVYAAPAAAEQKAASTAGTGRLSSAGQWGALTKELKWREKLLEDHGDALSKLAISNADRYVKAVMDEASPERLAKIARENTAAVRAMQMAQRQELEALPDAKQGEAIAAARAANLVNAAKGNAKRLTDSYQQDLENFRISATEFANKVAEAERNALAVERAAVAGERPRDQAGKIKQTGRLAELDQELADVDRRRAARIDDGNRKLADGLLALRAAAGKTLDPLEAAAIEFEKTFGKAIRGGIAEGGQAATDTAEAASAAWAAIAAKTDMGTLGKRFDVQLKQMEASLSGTQIQVELGSLTADMKAFADQGIRQRAIPGLRALRDQMAATAGDSEPLQAALAEIDKRLAEIGVQIAKPLPPSNFFEAADSAARDYLASIGSVARQQEQFFVNSFRGMESALTKFFETGKLSARDFGNVLRHELASLAAKQVMGAGGDWLKSLGGAGGLASVLTGAGAPIVPPIASQGFGMAGDAGTLLGFAGGGDHAGGWRLVGERGPELEATGPSRIFSADETRSILSGGAQSSDPGAVALTVVINNQTNTPVKARQQGAPTFDQGRWFVNMLVEAVETNPTARSAIAGAR